MNSTCFIVKHCENFKTPISFKHINIIKSGRYDNNIVNFKSYKVIFV
jgi:hypothetical protein